MGKYVDEKVRKANFEDETKKRGTVHRPVSGGTRWQQTKHRGKGKASAEKEREKRGNIQEILGQIREERWELKRVCEAEWTTQNRWYCIKFFVYGTWTCQKGERDTPVAQSRVERKKAHRGAAPEAMQTRVELT